MDPVDDILIPPEPDQAGSSRLRTKHVLRAFAVIVIIAAAGYASMLYRQDTASTIAHRQVDLLGVVPALLFGLVLWWYAGRKVSAINRPLFRNAADAESEVRMDRHNLFWVGVSMVAGFIGLSAATLGATLVLRREALITAYPFLREVHLSGGPLIIMGGVLIALAVVAMVFALRRRRG